MKNKIKARVLRPFMIIKWWYNRTQRGRSLECRTVCDILTKRDEIYDRYLKQDREGDVAGRGESKAFLKALDWVLMRKEQ